MVGRAVERIERSMATRIVATQTDKKISQKRQSFGGAAAASAVILVVTRPASPSSESTREWGALTPIVLSGEADILNEDLGWLEGIIGAS